MAKVITFSRTFPAYHPKSGESTNFVEKFWESVGLPDKEYCFNLPDEYQSFLRQDNNVIWAKHHTIRSGNRWKKGDYFSPRVWSGKPYNSKMITIAPDILITDILDFKILNGLIFIDGESFNFGEKIIYNIAKNDGLNRIDLLDWFKYPAPFSGQIIIWNESIKY